MTRDDRGDRRAVRVEDIADQLDMLAEGVTVYLDLHTHAFVTLFGPMIVGALDEQDTDPEDLDPERFLMLPTRFDTVVQSRPRSRQSAHVPERARRRVRGRTSVRGARAQRALRLP